METGILQTKAERVVFYWIWGAAHCCFSRHGYRRDVKQHYCDWLQDNGVDQEIKDSITMRVMQMQEYCQLGLHYRW